MIEMQCGKNHLQFLCDFKQYGKERHEPKDPQTDQKICVVSLFLVSCIVFGTD